MAYTLPRLPIFESISSHDPSSTAIIHSDSGRSFTYGELLKDVAAAREKLQTTAQKDNIRGERIAFLIENGYDYVGAPCAPPALLHACLGLSIRDGIVLGDEISF